MSRVFELRTGFECARTPIIHCMLAAMHEEHRVKYDAAAFSQIIASDRSIDELGVAAKGKCPAAPPIDPSVYDGDTELDALCMPESHEPSQGQGAAMQIAKEQESSQANEDDNKDLLSFFIFSHGENSNIQFRTA